MRLRRYVRLAVWSSASLAVTLFFMGLGLTSVFFFEVYFGDESNLKKSTILAKINEETSIFYLDEETRIGSFFEDYHRRYVPIDEVPQHLIDAVVASEDKYFYDHNGINPVAIFKAFWEGVGLFFSTGHPRFRGDLRLPSRRLKIYLIAKSIHSLENFAKALLLFRLRGFMTNAKSWSST